MIGSYRNIRRELKLEIVYYGIAIAVALLLAFIIGKLGKIQFGGYDGSILINHVWEYYLGYKPYVDIVTGWPPIILIGGLIAFQWWGIDWQSLVNIAGLFSAITFLWQFVLLKKYGLNALVSIVIASIIQSVTMVVISWWWYNHVTAVTGILFLSASLLTYQQPKNRFAQISFVVLASLLILSKPNIAFILFPASIFILMLLDNLRRLTSFLALLSLALSVTILLIFKINPLDMLYSYSHYAGGAFSIDRILQFLILNNQDEVVQTTISLIPCILALGIINYSILKGKSVEKFSLFFGQIGILIGVWGMMTNNEFNMTDAAAILFGIIIIAYGFSTSQTSKVSILVATLIAVSCLLLSAEGLQYATQRLRVKGVGVGAFYQDAPLTQINNPIFFNGMKVGPRMVRVLQEMQSTLQDHGYYHQLNAPVFFGPRVDFGYAAYGIAPYPGLPTWWEFFNKEGTEPTDLMISRFEQANFQMCVFLYRDFTYMPKSLIEYLYQTYNVTETDELTIFIRKP